MRKFVLLVNLWMILLLLCGALRADEAMADGEAPHAVRGLLDISGWSLERDGAVSLDGEWAFYWNRLLEPKDFAGPGSSPAPAYVQVPKEWHSYTIDANPLSNQGFATYRLKIKLSPDEVNRPEALYISSVASAYNLWIDGALAASNGTVGTSRDRMIPRNYAQIVTFLPAKPQVELVLQVSNFVQRKGGLWTSIRLGSERQISYKREKNVAIDAALFSSLAVMGIYHLVIFLLRRNDKSTLFFGGLCLAIAVRTLFVGERLAIRLFPGISWELGVKLEYLSFMLGIALIVELVYSQYPGEMRRAFRSIAIGVSGFGSLLVLATSADVYTYTLQAFQVWILLCIGYIAYVCVLALLRKREASLINCVALVFFICGAVNDILYYNHIVSTGDWFSVGLIGALFAEALILSMKYARSFRQVEKLSGELSVINETLEEKITERTEQLRRTVADLQKANSELAHMEASRRRLMSGISHELGTPLTSIQGYVKAIIDGVIDPGNPKYMNLIYEKTQYLDRMIGDLMELSKLEARQVAFHFEPLPAEAFFRRLYEKYELELRSGGLQVEWSGADAAVDGRMIAVLSGDPLRLEQVVANLLTNAKKFTPVGGTIRMELGFMPNPDTVTLSVSDTGAGIDEKDLPFIFDRFYRGKGPKDRSAGGTGLGLAIAKEIVEAHGGSIGVNSRPGQGSTFYFKLPAWLEPSGENDRKGV